MTYISEIKLLLSACGCESNIYKRKPTKCCKGECKPLTARERREVERVSKERGYRAFRAEMTSV